MNDKEPTHKKLAKGDIYIQTYKGEPELNLMCDDSGAHSPIDAGHDMLKPGFRKGPPFTSLAFTFYRPEEKRLLKPASRYASHIEFWFAAGCRWLHEVAKELPPRPLPSHIHYVRRRNRTGPLYVVRTIQVPTHLQSIYNTFNGGISTGTS